jgi:hypothetical protein
VPPTGPSDHALTIAREVADGLVGEGAEAAVLAVGPRTFSFRLERRGGLLASATSRPPEGYRLEMADPGSVGTAVPG